MAKVLGKRRKRKKSNEEALWLCQERLKNASRMSNEEKSSNNCWKLSGYVFLLTNIVLFWNAFYYVLLPNVFLEVNNDYQVILGLLHPIVKELSFRNYYHFAGKIGLQESSTLEIAWHSHMETTHAQFLSIILGNITNSETLHSFGGFYYQCYKLLEDYLSDKVQRFNA